MSDQEAEQQGEARQEKQGIYEYRSLSREFLLCYLVERAWASLNPEVKMTYAMAVAHANLDLDTYKALQGAEGNGSDAIYNVFVEKVGPPLSEEDETMWSESLPALTEPIFPSNSPKNFELFRNLLFTPGNRTKVLADFREAPKETQDLQMGWIDLSRAAFKNRKDTPENLYDEDTIQKGGDFTPFDDAEIKSTKIIWNARFL